MNEFKIIFTFYLKIKMKKQHCVLILKGLNNRIFMYVFLLLCVPFPVQHLREGQDVRVGHDDGNTPSLEDVAESGLTETSAA